MSEGKCDTSPSPRSSKTGEKCLLPPNNYPHEEEKQKQKMDTYSTINNSLSPSLAISSKGLNLEKKKPITKSKFDDPKLDPTWLFSELRKEICKESTYNLENDAKIRAVTQGTVNYEQFRQMVLGAHLRPLAKRDKVEGCQNGRRPPVWNASAVVKKRTGADDGDRTKKCDDGSASIVGDVEEKGGVIDQF